MISAEVPQNEPLLGTILGGRWRATRKIGEGGMGVVLAAEGIADAAPVAIKVLHREFLGEPQVVSRFIEEGRTVQRLVHPNILRILETGETPERRPFLVMELLEGVPLGAYTSGGARIPVHQAAPILQAILAGLGAAHASGIVHRDLKPDNVFLARDPAIPGRFAVKILDFGIAKVMDAAGGMGTKTKTGMLLGTPAYMSPEQIKNSKDVDARSDLFAAGVIFYEMITGRPAFPAPNEFAKLTAVLNDEPEALDRVDPVLTPLIPFVARAVHKDRDRRFQSAVEMAHALAHAIGAEPPGSRFVGTPLSQLPASSGGAPPMMGTAVVTPPGHAGTAASPAYVHAPTMATPVPPPAGAPMPGAPEIPGMPVIPGPPGMPSDGTRGTLISAPPPTPQVSSEALRAPGGTLTSAPSNPPPALDPAARVVMLPHADGRSTSAERHPARGVAGWIVAALIAAALVAGFLLGLAVGKMT